jgi:hypothetical protein
LTSELDGIDEFAVLDSSDLGQQDVDYFRLPIAHSFCEEIWEGQAFVLEATNPINGEFQRIGYSCADSECSVDALLGGHKERLNPSLFEEFDGVDEYVFMIV